ncbi:MAG: hypothetical protein H0W75_05250 [Chitinophagaceae bacterium]|nr:hypothetical protein [Chitinophagaceae bacterium]
MKKYIYTIAALLLFHTNLFSQARYVFIDFKDGQKPALQNDVSYSEKVVSGAIKTKLGKMGYKGKESKGFDVYRGVTLPELGAGTYDLYFKVDRKSKKEKDISTVTMLISRGNEVYITEAEDSQTINNAKSFLDNLFVSAAAYSLDQEIASQLDAVNKAEKKYKNLIDDADDLQKRKRKIEQQIEDNLKDQKNQQAEIEKQKQFLETLKARKK